VFCLKLKLTKFRTSKRNHVPDLNVNDLQSFRNPPPVSPVVYDTGTVRF
jgi:hypothetical protein